MSEAARRTGVPLPTPEPPRLGPRRRARARLLERSTQGLSLTDAGARLFASAELLALALLAQAGAGRPRRGGGVGRLRISLPPHFEPLWRAIEGFGQRHPRRALTSSSPIAGGPAADGVDVAIRVGGGGRSTYVGRTLARYRHRLVAAPAYVAGVPLERPEDLGRLACACWRSAAPSWQLGDVAFALDPLLATNDYQHLLHLALRGRVVTELPPFLAHGPLARGELVEVLPAFPLPHQTVRALVADTRLLSPLIRHFLDFAAEHVPAALDPYAGSPAAPTPMAR
ncbi:MAG: LysR substrate-binding domain-containing protein [bacterium]